MQDLHTVDNGVIQHLLPTIRAGNQARLSTKNRRKSIQKGQKGQQRGEETAASLTGPRNPEQAEQAGQAEEKVDGEAGADWDVLIAHFLGVDHVGHR